jgi:hypothetical protein
VILKSILKSRAASISRSRVGSLDFADAIGFDPREAIKRLRNGEALHPLRPDDGREPGQCDVDSSYAPDSGHAAVASAGLLCAQLRSFRCRRAGVFYRTALARAQWSATKDPAGTNPTLWPSRATKAQSPTNSTTRAAPGSSVRSPGASAAAR